MSPVHHFENVSAKRSSRGAQPIGDWPRARSRSRPGSARRASPPGRASRGACRRRGRARAARAAACRARPRSGRPRQGSADVEAVRERLGVADGVRAGVVRVADRDGDEAVDEADEPPRLGPRERDVAQDQLDDRPGGRSGRSSGRRPGPAGVSSARGLRTLETPLRACIAAPRPIADSSAARPIANGRDTARVIGCSGAQPESGYPARLFAHRLQRLVLRSADTPLRAVWALAYRVVARVGAAYFARGIPDASVYLRGGAAGEDLLPGMSDIDLMLVAPRDVERARRRWNALLARFPWTDRLIDRPLHVRRGRAGRDQLGQRADLRPRDGGAAATSASARPSTGSGRSRHRGCTARRRTGVLLRGPRPTAGAGAARRAGRAPRGLVCTSCCGGATRSCSAISRRRRARPTCA